MVETVRAETPVYGGYVIARTGKVTFVTGAVPGELVEVTVEENKKDYSLATVRSVLEPSPFRREAPCRIFGRCGGCQIQFIGYEKQVSIKEEILLDAMRRIGGIEILLMPSLTGVEFGYRHRGQFKVSPAGEIGFFRQGTREVIPVDECPLMIDQINAVLGNLKELDLRGLKEVHLSAGDSVTALLKGTVSEELCQEILRRGIAGVAFEKGDSLGKDYITLDLNGLAYSVTPWSFFQANWALNRKVVETVVGRLGPLEGKRVLDLYAGAGNFSLPLSGEGAEVVAVEENQFAVEDGRRNATLNGIRTCSFIHSTAEGIFAPKNMQKFSRLLGEGRYDLVVLDPPRPGLTSGCLKKIIEIGSKEILYVSCNPATLARDIGKMSGQYGLESLSLIDFFPNTYHIEAVAILKRKEGS
jgi:23S rRNA (uracil1939-C5)-methyltransferase